MGYLKEVHGMTLLGKTPEGTCPECAVKHDPEQPHNRDSLTYQYKFYDQHGRCISSRPRSQRRTYQYRLRRRTHSTPETG